VTKISDVNANRNWQTSGGRHYVSQDPFKTECVMTTSTACGDTWTGTYSREKLRLSNLGRDKTATIAQNETVSQRLAILSKRATRPTGSRKSWRRLSHCLTQHRRVNRKPDPTDSMESFHTHCVRNPRNKHALDIELEK